MRRRRRHPGRAGFTIVELMVAMALIIFIMYILAEAFAAGSKAFRDLKAIGDMNARLRTATAVLRRYLAADHFEGRKRLSDPMFWIDGPPKEGFFRIWQDDPSGTVNEGNDLDGIPSFRTVSHGLHFTVRLRGNDRSSFFRATVPSAASPLLLPTFLPYPDSRFQDAGSNVFSSPWAEVALYLKPIAGETTVDPNATAGAPLQLFTLFMRQRLLIPNNDDIPWGAAVPRVDTDYQPPSANYTEFSVTRTPPNDRTNVPPALVSSPLYFNSPADVTMPIRRFGFPFWLKPVPPYPTPAPMLPDAALNKAPSAYPTLADENSALAGSDVLLTDVVSMDVRVLLDPSAYVLSIPNSDATVTPATINGQPYFISLFDEIYPNDIWDDIRAKWPTGAGWPAVPGPDPTLSPWGTNKIITNKYLMPRNPPSYPFGTLGTARVFDTWSSRRDSAYGPGTPTSPPNPPNTDIADYTRWNQINQPETIPIYALGGQQPIRIRAIQITLRIWDGKSKQSRQVSIVQDM
jgi:type II secretory pathway pseudopilin PulG